MKKISKLTTLALTGLAFLVSPLGVFAQEPTNDPLEKINLVPTGYTTLGNLTVSRAVTGAIGILLVVAALLFFFMLLIGGIQWIVSGGDKTGSENARKKITNALIGLLIVFAAWAIVNLIQALFGINILQFEIQPIVRPMQ